MYCDYLEPTSTITKNNTISRFDSSNKYVLQQRLNRRCYRRELSTVGTAYHQPYHLILQDGAQIRYYNPFTLLSLTCVISRAAIDRILYGMILYIYDCHYTKLIIIFGVAFGVLRLPFLHFFKFRPVISSVWNNLFTQHLTFFKVYFSLRLQSQFLFHLRSAMPPHSVALAAVFCTFSCKLFLKYAPLTTCTVNCENVPQYLLLLEFIVILF